MEVGIIGLGLIGGSLAMVLKNRCNYVVKCYNRSASSLELAYNDGVIDEYISGDFSGEKLKIFENCDIIFVCTPIDMICDNVRTLLEYTKKDCVITDVGSTKNSILENLKSIKGLNFIGGHPMAGSEQTGYKAAKEHLFENAYYILAPFENITKDKMDILKNIVDKTGAITIIMKPNIHDKTVASISHGPHILASAIVNTVKKLDNSEKTMHKLAAGGFKDITRIASASPDIWTSISHDNADEIIEFINSYMVELNSIVADLKFKKTDEIHKFFTQAKEYRDGFSVSNRGFMDNYSISVDCEDKPGIIATVATILNFNSVNIKNIGIVNSREYENGILQILFDNEIDMLKSIDLLKKMNFIVYKK